MAEVYICYSKWNQNEAERITELLEESGIGCWLVSRDINYAKNWDQQVEDAVKSSVISIYLKPPEPSFRVLDEVRLIESSNTTMMTFETEPASSEDNVTGTGSMSGEGHISKATVEDIVAEVLRNIDHAREQKEEKERIYPYSGNEPFIFASYSHRDMEKVFKIIKGFQKRGYRIWFDEGIDPGTEWDEYIAEHIDKSHYMIAFLSENYFGSSNCRDELAFARDEDKPLLLIYIAADELPKGMQLRLNRLQAVHWYSYDDQDMFYEKAMSAAGLDVCKEKEKVTGDEA
ncbi:MAG: toll/interleukin-1 receptor domain-containing protein [Mogibacterium sp.]|nr:toll/interleukin-1 receptor domain-containing protein [Mogibacterium sp.]